MENVGGRESKFSNPTEELTYLRERLNSLEKSALSQESPVEKAGESYDPVREMITGFKEKQPLEVLTADYALKTPDVAAIVLDLSPEAHDRQMEELLALIQTKGVKNTLTVVEQMNNPHLEDDFHRFLVQYLKQAPNLSDLREQEPLTHALKMTLFEVVLPASDLKEGSGKSENEKIISLMEQFYAGLADSPFSLEIAVENEQSNLTFYVGIPNHKSSWLEKQLLSLFPKAKLLEKNDDYNIFNAEGVAVGSVGELTEYAARPLKTYEQFDNDPLNTIINSFSKLDRKGEGAALQIVYRPAEMNYHKLYQDKLTRLQKGEKTKEVLKSNDLGRDLLTGVGKFLIPSGKEKKPDEVKVNDEEAISSLQLKLASPIGEANIRLAASASSRPAAEAILADLESAFNQFAAPGGNQLRFRRLETRKLGVLLHAFSFRLFDKANICPLNFRELASLFHFPVATITATEQLHQVKSGVSAPPSDLPKQGITLGVNRYRGAETPIYFSPDDRLRHFYTIGQTGTGKSTLLKNMAIQDAHNGDGLCFIDPHGTDIIDILASIPPSRYEDVIYFDPSLTDRPLALNMLEYDRRFPDQKTFVVNELLAIFNKLFDMKTVGGPIFEQYFRNAALLVLDDPADNPTLLDISRVLSDAAYRKSKIEKCQNPIIRQFWVEVAEKAGGEAALQNVVPYITSKFDAFLTNDIMRPIIVQPTSSFNFRQIMDEKKILLVNLAKGRLGEINANLIGLILVGKLLQAALSRVDSSRDLPAFYLYIDEFQNITTDSTASILSEARKYKLSLHIAHQFISQLTDEVKNAVFGNVGTMAIFRTGADDAEYLEKQFAPVFSTNDLLNLDNRNAYLRLLVNGRPAKPFNIETLPPPAINREVVEKLKELSALKYGRPRAEVEAEIAAYYKQ